MAHARDVGVIEKASPEDLPEVLEVQKLAFGEVAKLYRGATIPPMEQTLAELQGEAEKRVVLKCVLDARIVGSVRGHLDERETCHIGRLVVRPECQGRGIGTALMDRIEAQFAASRRFEIFTGRETPHTVRLYQERGYRIYRSERTGFGELVFMEKLPSPRRAGG